MAIYTRGGDSGETALLGGTRIWKNDPRLETIGTLDELNASLGVAISLIEGFSFAVVERLQKIQHQLFSIGALLANPEEPAESTISTEWIDSMELWIDEYEETLPRLHNFILPSGTTASSALHIARAICRRAERNIITLHQISAINPIVLMHINRLSDVLFVMARYINFEGEHQEIIWKPADSQKI